MLQKLFYLKMRIIKYFGIIFLFCSSVYMVTFNAMQFYIVTEILAEINSQFLTQVIGL
jgi:hypothetical protein